MEITDKPPWSGKALSRLGDAIRQGHEREFTEIEYSDVILWYGTLAKAVEERISGIDFSSILGPKIPSITSRPKTITTLRDKLIAHPNWQLPNIVDVAGVRLEASMDLRDQDDVAAIVSNELEQDIDAVLSDTRTAPHSGYRAVHLRTKLAAGRVEVQIRTHLQGAWANQFEALADLIGRHIRYDKLPEGKYREFVNITLRLSNSIREVEEARVQTRELRKELDKSYNNMEDIILKILASTTRDDQSLRGKYSAELEVVRAKRKKNALSRTIGDVSNDEKDQKLIADIKMMEEALRKERQKG